MRVPVPFDRDLFGEVRVTHDDLSAWLRAVPRIDPDGPRAAAYIRGYSVVEKVQRAKLAGDFEAIVADSRPDLPPLLGAHFGFALPRLALPV